ncbi:hypothetical protein [Pedobacter mendelii]|uniref:DUF4230 domain-containing protein n=1 Tax=Pedobacter mendelii TaxID=1908240 RepID=A0ABQ2BFS1_9SPHI|nr:hypothetical protein [Pedobacter mendelii]GGI23866.1 hypothetical protein GCM10008119_09800 [Pedobacter mendelii]
MIFDQLTLTILWTLTIGYILWNKYVAPTSTDDNEPLENETDGEFYTRIQDEINQLLLRQKFTFFYNDETKLFSFGLRRSDGTLANFQIGLEYNSGSRLVIFSGKFNPYPIPKLKVDRIGELVNRINLKLSANVLVLDYEKRIVLGRMIYKVGSQNLDEALFNYHYEQFSSVFLSTKMQKTFTGTLERKDDSIQQIIRNLN